MTSIVTPVKGVLVGCANVQSLLLSMLVHEITGTVDGRAVALSLWPTQAQEDRFLAYSGADVIAIMCDTTDAASIQLAENALLHEVRGVLSRTPVLLVGVLPVPSFQLQGTDTTSAPAPASLINTAEGREISIRMEACGYYFLDLTGEDRSFSASFELFAELCRIGMYYREVSNATRSQCRSSSGVDGGALIPMRFMDGGDRAIMYWWIHSVSTSRTSASHSELVY